VFCLGHSHPEVNEAIRTQLDLVAHAYRYNFSSDPLEELIELVGRRAGSDLRQMVFTCGGSEAVESALKIALHFHWANGEPNRTRFIARRRSWHGNTLGALSVSDLSDRQAPYRGSMLPVSHISPANAFRPPDGVDAARLLLGAAELRPRSSARSDERRRAHLNPLSARWPCRAHATRVWCARCDRHGVLMIADEVMCAPVDAARGALEHDGVVPDIMAVAKGLGGGPLGATLYHRESPRCFKRSRVAR
jgi:adenosylmethionine-8-amino-7-oxononanoate aminotransferase